MSSSIAALRYCGATAADASRGTDDDDEAAAVGVGAVGGLRARGSGSVRPTTGARPRSRRRSCAISCERTSSWRRRVSLCRCSLAISVARCVSRRFRSLISRAASVLAVLRLFCASRRRCTVLVRSRCRSSMAARSDVLSLASVCFFWRRRLSYSSNLRWFSRILSESSCILRSYVTRSASTSLLSAPARPPLRAGVDCSSSRVSCFFSWMSVVMRVSKSRLARSQTSASWSRCAIVWWMRSSRFSRRRCDLAWRRSSPVAPSSCRSPSESSLSSPSSLSAPAPTYSSPDSPAAPEPTSSGYSTKRMSALLRSMLAQIDARSSSTAPRLHAFTNTCSLSASCRA
eukprot:Unigene15420_Nuclearia_a/m.46062 Unigene15420_Nuclearia_a/g.46062  ORF Unigene15420_Nuclearia_a/g.46062 Unigene15420_Nuclearia_a/m.46062 type:complete len:344 (-) Unigene15420_Nuclearia_a:1687-2718(-)